MSATIPLILFRRVAFQKTTLRSFSSAPNVGFFSRLDLWRDAPTNFPHRCRRGRSFSTGGPSPLPPHIGMPNDDEDKENKPSVSSPQKSGAAISAKPPASRSVLPGVGLSAATAAVGFQLASALSFALSVPLSGIPVSILLGMAVKNAVGYDESKFKPGIVCSTKTILQGGIVAVAAKLSFFELLATGSSGLPVVLASVGAGMLYIPWAGRKAGLPSEMSLLLTAGTSICGVTAITALAPAIKASNRDVAVAVANTVAFGTIGMLVYPYVFHELCWSSEHVGVCLGVAIHDTSQVLGSAMSYRDAFGDELALKVAAVTKLTRNLGLAVAIPALSYLHATSVTERSSAEVAKADSDGKETVSGLVSFQKYVPPFLIAFVGMSTLRSFGDFYFIAENATEFNNAMNFVGNDLSKYALGTAMAGVGLSTSGSSLKGVGLSPFIVGGTGALVVGGTGFAVAAMTM